MSHRGRHYTVENARIYTLPEQPIDVMVAAGGSEAAKVAGRVGDGFGTASSRPPPTPRSSKPLARLAATANPDTAS